MKVWGNSIPFKVSSLGKDELGVFEEQKGQWAGAIQPGGVDREY